MFEATASEAPQGVTPLYSKTTLSGLIWPDGSGSIGRVAARDVSEDSLKLDPYSTQEIIDHIGSNDPLGALKIDAVERAAPLLDIPCYFEETPPRARKGLGGITRKGRKSVVNGGLIIESYFERSRLSFVTLTVPPLPESSRDNLNQGWGETCHRFKTGLGDRLRPYGLDGVWVYCSEVQEKRFLDTNEVYLHLHLVFPNKLRGSKSWLLSIPDLRELWIAAMRPAAPEVDQCPWVQVKAEPVKKSVKGYLGKYLSKGAQLTQEVIDAGLADHLPKHWWGSSQRVKDRVSQHSVEPGQDLADLLWEMCSHGPGEEVTWCHPVMVETYQGEPLHVGWSFQLSPDFARELQTLYAQLPPRW
jgi:hypothetical protein